MPWAFADDSDDRNRLGPFARRRARDAHGIDFPPEDIFVIGDTPHDIACAKAIQARAVGVATGRYSRSALEAQVRTSFLMICRTSPGVVRTLGLAETGD